jgi:hypothetical protein
MMNAKKNANLLEELRQFTGSESFYYHPTYRKFIYTEGVKHLIERAKAYWLLDCFIFPKQGIATIKKEEFQVWTIRTENERGTITLEDGNGNEICRFLIPYTDFPLDECTLWFIGGTVLLPSEY